MREIIEPRDNLTKINGTRGTSITHRSQGRGQTLLWKKLLNLKSKKAYSGIRAEEIRE